MYRYVCILDTIGKRNGKKSRGMHPAKYSDIPDYFLKPYEYFAEILKTKSMPFLYTIHIASTINFNHNIKISINHLIWFIYL